MKSFKQYLIAVAAGAMILTTATSCLDENPNDRLPVDEAYSTRNELYLNAVANIYREIGSNEKGKGLQGMDHGLYDLNTFSTDEAVMPTRGTDWFDGGYWQALYLHRFGEADGTGDPWNYLYKQILACNSSLYRIDLFVERNRLAGDPQIAMWRAEVRALRAMFYFYAMDLYGRISVFDAVEPTPEQMKLKKRSEAYRYIVSELQDVLYDLSYAKSNTFGEYYGRITRGPAAFLLAKLLINAEVYAHDDWTVTPRPDGKNIFWDVDGQRMNSWQAAVYYCDVISDMDYVLEPDFTHNFAVNNETSRENIFTIPMDKHLYSNLFVNKFRSLHYNHAAALGLNGENGAAATLEALRAFGYPPREGYVSELDPRFYDTYYVDEVYDLTPAPVLLDDGTPLRYDALKVALDVSGTPWEKTAGARMAKYEVDVNSLKDGKLCDNDIVLFRYADVLLMRAEALVRDGRDGSADFNAVRERVLAEPRPCTLDNILTERLLELAWEGWRRNDMIRFGTFTRPYSDRPQLDGEANGYTTVYPIPGGVLTLTGDEQNPGY